MIRRDRTSVHSPSVLTSKRADSERTRADAFYRAFREATAMRPVKARGARRAQPTARAAAGKMKTKRATAEKATTKKKFNFAVYKEEEVKKLLHHLFQGKCAYCEARYVATQPMDVEHFRPKSEVTDFDGSKRVGYYWLAAEWTNLLPSCIDCNRPRNYEDAEGKPLRLGKDTLFPLVPNSPRASFGASVDNERPLLLDPCRDRPEEYLEFSEGVAGPSTAPRAPADAAARVNASLRVYGLNRTDLVHERRQVLLNLRRRCHQIRALTVALETAQTAQPADVRHLLTRSLADLISHETDAILRMAKESEPFSLMVRQEIAAFEAELGRGLGPSGLPDTPAAPKIVG
jgi:uncharacterized protein (TIGR02646 family)